jgi:hypothetical protein
VAPGHETIDVTVDFRCDAGGRDPDTWSLTLARYHQLLWSKSLPSGAQFELDRSGPPYQLHHCSDELGEFRLSSDAVIPSFWKHVPLKPIVAQIPDRDREEMRTVRTASARSSSSRRGTSGSPRTSIPAARRTRSRKTAIRRRGRRMWR